MGCLNPNQGFNHYFANIHLSGPCNRSCYFCIGQDMMGLDSYNNLDKWPLDGWNEFIEKCIQYNVEEINITGTNTDPSLYKHLFKLTETLRLQLGGVVLGIRTNGVKLPSPEVWKSFDKASISITSFDPDIYKKTMGQGEPPDLQKIAQLSDGMNLKVNIVLVPEVLETLIETIKYVGQCGIRRVNMREPYGQPHVGDPLKGKITQVSSIYGMPQYKVDNVTATYWDVHYVEVESVNLYANGNVSVTYPITKGYDPKVGRVQGQEHFTKFGRKRQQWVGV